MSSAGGTFARPFRPQDDHHLHDIGPSSYLGKPPAWALPATTAALIGSGLAPLNHGGIVDRLSPMDLYLRLENWSASAEVKSGNSNSTSGLHGQYHQQPQQPQQQQQHHHPFHAHPLLTGSGWTGSGHSSSSLFPTNTTAASNSSSSTINSPKLSDNKAVGGGSSSANAGGTIGGGYFSSSSSTSHQRHQEDEDKHREEEEAIYRNLFADDDEDDVPRRSVPPQHHRLKDQQQQQPTNRSMWNNDGEEVGDLSSSFMGPLFRRSSSSTNSPTGSPPGFRSRSPPMGSPPNLGSPEVSTSRNLDIDASLSASFPGKDGNMLLGSIRGGGLTSPGVARPALSPREVEVEASYVMTLRTWLVCRGAFDMKSGVLLAQVGAACPKPPELVNRTLRNILEDNPAFSVIPDPSKTTRQVVWLTRNYRGDIQGAAMSRFAAANRTSSLTASPTLLNKSSGGDSMVMPPSSSSASTLPSVTCGNVEQIKLDYLSKIRAHLQQTGALAPHTAIFLNRLGYFCRKPEALGEFKLAALLEDAPGFTVSQDRQRVWLNMATMGPGNSGPAAGTVAPSSTSSVSSSLTTSTNADAMIRSSYFEVARHHPPAATTTPSGRDMMVGPACVRGASVSAFYEASMTKPSAAAVTIPVLPESIKQNYCDVVKRVLLKHGATSRSTSVKLSWIGEQCPKPHPLMKIRPVLEECADLAVEQDPHDKLVQHLWVRILPAVDEAAKQQYLQRVKSYLLKSGAVDQSSAALLTWVGDACPKPLELPKLRALLEESPDFAMAADPLKPQRQLVWLKVPGSSPDMFSSQNSANDIMSDQQARSMVDGSIGTMASSGLSSPDRPSLDTFFSLPACDDEKEVAHQQEMQELYHDLAILRDGKVLSQCLDPTYGRDFQLLSFLGDAVLHNRVTRALLAKMGHDLQCDPANLSHLRAASGQHQTLAKVFQEAGLHMLVAAGAPSFGGVKGMASTLLALVGEMDVKMKEETTIKEEEYGEDMGSVMKRATDRIMTAVMNRGMYLKGDTTNSTHRPMAYHRRQHTY